MEKKKINFTLKGKGGLLVITVTFLMVAAVLVVLGKGLIGGEEQVQFKNVKEAQIPGDIATDVIPEYRTMERALACVVGDDVYVLVTRGEKPSSGYDVYVDKMTLTEKEGRTNLIVYAVFEDPDKKTPISQIITYPFTVAKTDLNKLPDTIELRIQY